MRNHFLRAATGKSLYDTDAQTYITAVENADGQILEAATKNAINAFVVGCKDDGIWNAIKASCILAGARTLAGALTSLVGTAPTPFNFVSGDYNRKTGLVGNGSSKYLNSNRAGNADPQNNYHASVYTSSLSTFDGTVYLGNSNTAAGSTNIGKNSVDESFFRAQSSGFVLFTPTLNGLLGVSRNNGSNFTYRINQSSSSSSTASQSPSTATTNVFALGDGSAKSNARIAFYSIGESLDLALLNARVTALINAINAAF